MKNQYNKPCTLAAFGRKGDTSKMAPEFYCRASPVASRAKVMLSNVCSESDALRKCVERRLAMSLSGNAIASGPRLSPNPNA